MKLEIVKKETKEVKDFLEKEWAVVNKRHFGSNFAWNEKQGTILAKENDEIIGYLHYLFHGGVMEILTLIVSDNHLRKGVGTLLMKKVEKIAIKEGAHKMYLITSFGERAIKFYESLGFVKTNIIKNHYRKIDMTELSKTLN